MSNKGKGGRKCHQYWIEGNFVPTYFEKSAKQKIAAKCKMCDNILKNTSMTRLQTHRKSCPGVVNGIKTVKYKKKPVEDKYVVNNPSSYDKTTTVDNGEADTKYEKLDLVNPADIDYDDNMTDLQQYTTTSLTVEKLKSNAYEEATIEEQQHQYNINDQPSPGKKSKIKKIKIERIDCHNTINLTDFNLPSTSTTSEGVIAPTATATTANHQHFSETETLDVAIAKFFYSCQIPFETADSLIFKDLIKALRPGYKPPTCEQLSTNLLEKVHDEIYANQSKYDVKEESILIVDSQENSLTKTKKAVTLLLSENGMKTFLDCHDFSSGHESQEDFIEIINSSAELAKKKFNTNVYAALTNLEDGESVTNIWHNSCNFYCGNLLAQDITDKDVAVKVNNILIDFKQNQNEKSLLEYGGTNIMLPLKLNWTSYRDSFECVLENLERMKQIATDSSYNGKPRIEFTNKRLLFNNDFIEKIKSHVIRLNPICDLVHKCRSSKFTLADAAEEWLSIDLGDEFQDSLKIIRNSALKKYALAANILHPLYRGSRLSNEQREEGEIFIFDELDASGLDDYQAYCSNNSKIFNALAQKSEIAPKTFWGLANRKHPQLSRLALKLLLIPAALHESKILKSLNTDLWSNLDSKAMKQLLYIQYSLSCFQEKHIKGVF